MRAWFPGPFMVRRNGLAPESEMFRLSRPFCKSDFMAPTATLLDYVAVIL